jgi:enterobactin synthetase component D
VLTQPLAADNFVGIDTELWLGAQQAADIAASIHLPEEQDRLQKTGLSAAQATTLLFSAKEALFKAICPFVGGYFGFDAAQLRSCTVNAGTEGWLELQLTADWVAARAPQLRYRCWFRCSKLDVLTLVCSDALSELWCRS